MIQHLLEVNFHRVVLSRVGHDQVSAVAHLLCTLQDERNSVNITLTRPRFSAIFRKRN